MTLQRNLAQAFDSIPESKFGYRPTPAQLTIGYIAQHLASDNYLFCNNVRRDEGDDAAEGHRDARLGEGEVAEATRSREGEGSRSRSARRAFAQLDDAKLGDQVSLTFGGQSRTVTRASMVLGHALDMADHYSQLANYMRLNNMVPPTALPRPARGGN